MGLCDEQNINHCGPCSVSYALFLLLGQDVEQSKVVKAVYPVTGYLRVACNGMDPFELGKAAAKFGVEARPLSAAPEGYVRKFHRPLYRAVESGQPAILCVNYGPDCTHWICLVGVDGRGGFVVCDPDASDVFTHWSRRDIQHEVIEADPDTDEQSGYFALLLSRADGTAPAFKMSDRFMKVIADGTYAEVGEIREDLVCLATRLGHGRTPLGKHLMACRAAVLGALDRHLDWASTEEKLEDLKVFYDDYVAVAHAAGITTARKVDRVKLAAEMAAIFTTVAWCSEL